MNDSDKLIDCLLGSYRFARATGRDHLVEAMLELLIAASNDYPDAPLLKDLAERRSGLGESRTNCIAGPWPGVARNLARLGQNPDG